VAIIQKDPLTPEHVRRILRSPDQYTSLIWPPAHVRHGDVYLYRLKRDRDRDYARDKISVWKSQGTGISERWGVKKRYYNLLVDGELLDHTRRLVYCLADVDRRSGSHVLIQYLGDEKLFTCKPHRNRKKGNKPFVSVMHHVREKLRKMVGTKRKPVEIFDESIKQARQELGDEFEVRHPIAAPRNLKQIKYYRTVENQTLRIDKDSMHAIEEMGRTATGKLIIHKQQRTPTIQIIVADPYMIQFANLILTESCLHPELRQLLAYDTTFNLSQCYVSVLVMRNVLMEGDPIIPVAYLIHQHKDLAAHKGFWELMSSELNLSKRSNDLVIITDKETSIRKAITDVLPAARLYLCHNHLLKNIEQWIDKNPSKLEGGEMSRRGYVSSIRVLLSTADEREWHKLYEKYRHGWSDGFVEYIETRKIGDLLNYSKYKYDKEAAFGGGISPTTNISESENARIKRMVGGSKQLLIDTLVLTLHQLQLRLLSDISLSFGPSGDYAAKTQYAGWKSKFTLPPYVGLDEKEFVLLLKGELNVLRKEEAAEVRGIPSCSIRAAIIASLNYVSINSAAKVFVVTDNISFHKTQVRFDCGNWQYKCQCGSVGLCLHVKAVLLGQNIEFDHTATAGSSVTFMRKIRRKFGRSGRKRPAIGDDDFHLIPAADSEASRVGNMTTFDREALQRHEEEHPEEIGETQLEQTHSANTNPAQARTTVTFEVTPNIVGRESMRRVMTDGERAIQIAAQNYVHLDSASKIFTVTDEMKKKRVIVRFDGGVEDYLCAECDIRGTCVHVKAVHRAQGFPDMTEKPMYKLGILKSVSRKLGLSRNKRKQCNINIGDMNESMPDFNDSPELYHSTPLRVGLATGDINASPSPPRAVARVEVKPNNHSALPAAREGWLTSTSIDEGLRGVYIRAGSVQGIGCSPLAMCELVATNRLEAMIQVGARNELLDNDVILQPINTEALGDGAHWVLGVICLTGKQLCIIDSMVALGNTYAAQFKMLFTIAAGIVAGGGGRIDPSRWVCYKSYDMVQQTNPRDCGPLVLMAADAIMRKQDIAAIDRGSCRPWVEEILADQSSIRMYKKYNGRVAIPDEVIKKYLNAVNVAHQLPSAVEYNVGLLIMGTLDDLNQQWSMCGADNSCAGDSTHEQVQRFCVLCRTWYHEICDTLQKKSHPPYPSYYYCSRCFDRLTS